MQQNPRLSKGTQVLVGVAFKTREGVYKSFIPFSSSGGGFHSNEMQIFALFDKTFR
jgi:hypothetical protein